MLEDNRPLESEEARLADEQPLHQGLPLDKGDNWSGKRAYTLQKIAPNISAIKGSDETRTLRRYLLAALGFMSVGVILALLDERGTTHHMTVVVAGLMMIVVLISAVIIYRTKKAMEGLAHTVAPSFRDSITGLPDEEYFRLRLRDEFKRMHRYNTELSLALLDVNNLTSVNEAYGEAAGDAVLKHIAGLLDSTKRASDVSVRLGDDEFALILLECGEEDAMRFLNRLERAVARKPVTVNVEGQAITLWVGMCSGTASTRRDDSTPQDLVAQARHNLEMSKEDRDRRRERWTSAAP